MRSSIAFVTVAGLVVCGFTPAFAGDVYEEAIAVAPCDAYGRRIGPWESLRQTPNPHVQVPSWIPAFDNESTDLALTGNPSVFTNIYGTLAAGTRTAFDVNATGMVTTGGTAHFNAPFMLNDVTIAPVSQGGAGYRMGINQLWNPAGTYPTVSGTAPKRIVFYTYDSAGEFLSGVLYNFGAASAAGSFNSSSVPTTPVNVALSLPWGAGFIGCAIGVDDGLGNFVQLPAPGVAAHRFFVWSSPTDPYFPGTNPSNTQPGFLLDDSRTSLGTYVPTTTNPSLNSPDFIINFASETIPATGADAFIFGSPIVASTRQIEPAIMIAADANCVYFEGQLDLQDLDPGTARPVTNADFEIRQAGTTTPLVTRRLALGPNGEFKLMAYVNLSAVVTGDFDISVKKSHWLRQTIGPISMTGATVTGLTISCVNGDADGDNEVGIGDFALVSAAYNTSFGDAGYVIDADFNHDDAIDIADYAILSSNYGLTGDD